MTTHGLIIVCVLSVLIVLALAAVIAVPRRLRAHKPLETHPHHIADPLPLSVVRRQETQSDAQTQR